MQNDYRAPRRRRFHRNTAILHHEATWRGSIQWYVLRAELMNYRSAITKVWLEAFGDQVWGDVPSEDLHELTQQVRCDASLLGAPLLLAERSGDGRLQPASELTRLSDFSLYLIGRRRRRRFGRAPHNYRSS